VVEVAENPVAEPDGPGVVQPDPEGAVVGLVEALTRSWESPADSRLEKTVKRTPSNFAMPSGVRPRGIRRGPG